jgi:hypothetical protein
MPEARDLHDGVRATVALRTAEPILPSPLDDRRPALIFDTIKGHEIRLRQTLLELLPIARHRHFSLITDKFAEDQGNAKPLDGA